ncbi:hypothetical protein BAE44_0001491 [Dichanthelium oligosanthes]|uniref:Uncharacterized protein n=1 Tax=Dichanthelium oligosanthes TaxID=888268 RepID=A0A1E5WK27_9POAL|nr:hypothetical protein BAE44_0001491 [Dichanthelium oligosanthes]
MDDLLGDDDGDVDALCKMPAGGRDEANKEALVRALLDDDQRDQQHNVRVLLIVDAGTTKQGGPGKSSLATMVLDDPRVRNHFEQMSWRRVPRELEAAAVS